MKNSKTLTSQAGFHLVQVDTSNEAGSVIRTSYEVVDPSEDVIGRFWQLTRGSKFY